MGTVGVGVARVSVGVVPWLMGRLVEWAATPMAAAAAE